MKILVLHNAYQQPGGEDAVVRNEVEMLRARGHDVHLHQVSNHAISGGFARLRAAVSAVFSVRAYLAVRTSIRRFRPDVVHVHNVFPLLSPSVFYACSQNGVPSVLTLHNFRIACPTSLLMHEGVVTERSLVEGPWWAVPRRVYRGSLVGTAVVAAMIAVHRRLGTWSRTVTRFIALTHFSVSRFELAGVPRERMHVKPNFVDVPAPAPAAAPRSGFLFAGRLSREKGIGVLAAALRQCEGRGVRVAGEGPLTPVLEELRSIELLGMVSSAEMSREMSAACALVMPSIWYEGFPMVIVEAYAHGLPVIASRLGAMAELVEDGVTGLLFDPGCSEDLARKMRWASEHASEMARMGSAARARYEALYTAEANHAQLIDIYHAAIAAAGGLS
jgi:glycosyltransferase involved in cell wall biosynthesis